MVISEEKKQKYIDMVHKERERRGYTPEQIPMVIGKTGFTKVMEQYPEEQMHYSIEDAVDEIMFVALLQ